MRSNRWIWLIAVLAVELSLFCATSFAELTYEGITVMAVAHEQPVWNKVAEQVNNPALYVEPAESPPAGQEWVWSLPGGDELEPLNNTFTSPPTIQIVATYDRGMRAEIQVANIIDADWQANASGYLKLHIENSATPGVFFEPMVKVSARCISTIDFTVFKGQSEAGSDNVSAGPGATASTRYEWSAPAPHALFFEGLEGSPFDTRLSVRESVLSATTSAQPGSPIRGDRYILPIGAVGTAWVGNDRKIATWNGSSWNFETPEKGWICYSNGDADYFYMNNAYESGGAWVTGLTTGSGTIGFEFDAADTARRYGRIVVSGWLGDWPDFTGNFSLNIKEVDGAGTQTSSESRFNTLGGVSTTPNIRLRELAGDGYTIIEGQSSGGETVLAYTGTKDMVFSPTCPTDVAFSIDSMGRLLSPSVSDPLLWGTDTTFDLEIADGLNRPPSFFKSYPAVPSKDKPRALSLRRLVPEALTIPNDGRAGSINLQVGGDAGPWDWFAYEDGLANSVLTAPDSYGSSSLTVSWAAGELETDETGTGTVTIQRSDGSAPASTVSLETTVNEAPQMPVSCWPILAAILAIVAVVLIVSQKYRTVG